MNETPVTATAEAGAPDVPEARPQPLAERQPEPLPEPPLAKELGPRVETNGERRLDPRYVPFQRAVGWIVTASMSASVLLVLGILWLTAELPAWVNVLLIPAWFLMTLGIGWLFYVWPAVHYRHASYVLDAEGIEIRSGVWWREVVSVPRSRVQHIDVSQGPMERSYDLGRLVLYTAGTAHSRVELVGVNHAVAFALREHLLPRGSDDAV